MGNHGNRAVGYTRVSTDRQADEGVSLDAQAEKIRQMAAVDDLEVVEVVTDDGASAKNMNRSGLARVLDLVDNGAVDVVIVAKLDRLTRSVRDLGELLDRFERRRVSLVSVAEKLDTSSAAGRLVLNVMGSVSQWEREVIGERTREALAFKRTKGQRISRRPPFGQRVGPDGVHLEDDPDELDIVAKVQRMRREAEQSHDATKRLSLRAIAAELNRQGHRTRTGGPWRHTYVHRVLQAAQA